MKPLGSLDDAETKVLHDARTLLIAARRHTRDRPADLSAAIDAVAGLRRDVYEELNQVLHEGLLVRAARRLAEDGIVTVQSTLLWNPRQTGHSGEPDLAVMAGRKRIASVEVTASADPKGVIDTRMQHTLNKLMRMSGRRFYFVTTDAMRRRALTKVNKAGWNVTVERL